ncbi:MAG: DUF3347 domain-containing protein [Cyclobacteriaceae bacterium]|nr:DUF3347 domain-containing protein [Cyclobacteriaceae bacterium]
MKKIQILLMAILISFWACNPKNSEEQTRDEKQEPHDEIMGEKDMGEHDGHDHGQMVNPHNDGTHAEKMVAQLNVPEKFHQQLNEVFESSIPLKEAFVKSDPEKVKEAAGKVVDQLGKVDSKLLETQAHEIWMQNLMSIAHLLDQIKNAGDLEEQRQIYAMFNRAMYRSFKFLGHEGDPIYYQYCPMAFDNKGAYWLSETKVIRNPYFGDRMLTCGSTKEVLN